MTEQSAFQIQIAQMDKKLDDHGDDLKEIRKTLETIAVQAVQIGNLQASQAENRGDINALFMRFSEVEKWQATCPRKSIARLWGIVMSVSSIFGLIMLYHLLGVKQ